MNVLEILALVLAFFFAGMTWEYRRKYIRARHAALVWRKRAWLAPIISAAVGAGAAWWIARRNK